LVILAFALFTQKIDNLDTFSKRAILTLPGLTTVFGLTTATLERGTWADNNGAP
jgi:hypothetical protein